MQKTGALNIPPAALVTQQFSSKRRSGTCRTNSQKPSEEDPTKALLAYRATPLASGYSPAELLMVRKIKSTMPTMPHHLKPQLPNQEFFKENEEYRVKQKQNFDDRHKAQPLKHLPLEAAVYVTDMDCTGTVIRPSKKPRSYVVNTPTTVVRRNRVQQINISMQVNKTGESEHKITLTLNTSSIPKRIKTISLKARENLGLE